MSTQKYFKLNPTSSGVNSYPSDIQVELQSILSNTTIDTRPKFITDTLLSAPKCVTLDTNGKVIIASANIQWHAEGILGITDKTYQAGDDDVRPLTDGTITLTGWNLTVNQPIYLGLDGALTQTVPINPPLPAARIYEYVKVLGTATSADTMLVSLEPAITLPPQQ